MPCNKTLYLTIIVPLVMGRDRNSVGNLADDVELLNADLVDLVEDVDAGDVGSVTLDNINQFIRSSITPSKCLVWLIKH